MSLMSFIKHSDRGVVYMAAPNIKADHAFTTRFGGVSAGVYASMNLGLGSGDSIEHIRENYSLLCAALGITVSDIVCSRQVRGADVRAVTYADRGGLFTPYSPEADALVTCDPGAALLVFTADCVPILLHDPVRGACGAVHSGWQGTAAGVVVAAVGEMVSRYGCNASDITAAIGPCISECCFETDRDVPDAMAGMLGDDLGACMREQNGKFMVDLKKANKLLLNRAGLHDISISDECTSCRCDKYWSHRKTAGSGRGSQAAIIVAGTGAPYN